MSTEVLTLLRLREVTGGTHARAGIQMTSGGQGHVVLSQHPAALGALPGKPQVQKAPASSFGRPVGYWVAVRYPKHSGGSS
jgi:hypothetical protein